MTTGKSGIRFTRDYLASAVKRARYILHCRLKWEREIEVREACSETLVCFGQSVGGTSTPTWSERNFEALPSGGPKPHVGGIHHITIQLFSMIAQHEEIFTEYI
jgi:hypothetical protein